MSTKFDVRVEYPNGSYEDVKVNAATSKDVPAAFSKLYTQFGRCEWHGLVVFVDGARPAELKIEDRQLRESAQRVAPFQGLR